MSARRDLFEVLCRLARPGTDDLRDGVLKLADFDAVKVGPEIDWSADPFGHPHWRHRLHSLDFLWPALKEGRLHYAERLISNWLDKNPLDAPQSDYSWAHHTTAKRARVLASVHLQRPSRWLEAGLRLHGEVLSNEAFYAKNHNHGIAQDISLVVIGTAIRAPEMVDLAMTRARVASHSKVDVEGMVDEQAPAYQGYVLDLYKQFASIAEACDEPLDGILPDLESMERALADLLLPHGQLAPIGDTYWEEDPEFDLPEPPIEPSVRIYRAGYVLGRHPDTDGFYALRFGPGRSIHGHDDHTSLILHSDGQPRPVEGGHVGYERSTFRDHLRGPRAHNVAILAEETFDHSSFTDLVADSSDSFTFVDSPHPGVRRTRTARIELSPLRIHVTDNLYPNKCQTAHQYWHLPPGSEVEVEAPTATVLFSDGRVMRLTQQRHFDRMSVAIGDEDPYLGWYALKRNRIPSPVIVTWTSGTSIEFQTAIEMD